MPYNVFNVQDYGASNSDSTGLTNYAAFNDAISAATATGGLVYIAPVSGYYRIDASAGPIEIPEGMRIIGTSASRFRGSRIVHHAGSILFRCRDGLEARYLENFSIRGGVAGGIGIQVQATQTYLHQIAFSAYTGESCIEYADSPTSVDGPWNCHASRIQIECYVNVSTPATIDYGIRARSNWNGCSITESTITGAKIAGIAIEHGSGSAIRSTNVEHNETGLDSVGILIGAGAGMPNAITVDSVESESNYSAAIRVQKCQGLVIQNLYDLPGGDHRLAPYSIDINDASGNGSNVKGVVIVGGYLGYDGPGTPAHAAIADIRITGTTEVTCIGQRSDTDFTGTGTARIAGNILTGNIVATGREVSVDGFRSNSGTTAPLTSGQWTPLFNATLTPSGAEARGIFFLYVSHLDSTDGLAFATIISDRTNARIANQSNGGGVSIQMSGDQVEVRQTYGSNQVVSWTVLYVPTA